MEGSHCAVMSVIFDQWLVAQRRKLDAVTEAVGSWTGFESAIDDISFTSIAFLLHFDIGRVAHKLLL